MEAGPDQTKEAPKGPLVRMGSDRMRDERQTQLPSFKTRQRNKYSLWNKNVGAKEMVHSSHWHGHLVSGAAQDRQVPWSCCPQFAPQNEHSSTCSIQSKDITVGQAWCHISWILALKRWRQKTQGQTVLDSIGNSRSALVIWGLVSNKQKVNKETLSLPTTPIYR